LEIDEKDHALKKTYKEAFEAGKASGGSSSGSSTKYERLDELIAMRR
jgi:hypothetical protein